MLQKNPASDIEAMAASLRSAYESRDLNAFAALLDERVRWGGAEDTPETCHSRQDVLNRLSTQIAAGLEVQVLEVVPGDGSIMVGFKVTRPVAGGFSCERHVYQVLNVRNQLVVDIREHGSRSEAAAIAGVGDEHMRALEVSEVIPILNVSSLADSFEWFGKLGWSKRWDWRDTDSTPTFGAIGSGHHEIFLAANGQGGRGRDGGIGGGGQGMWLSVWVGDVDVVYGVCAREGLDVIRPPQNEPWGVREMHVRHPDGHVLRISQAD
jgi:hypothetical protein